MSATRILIPTLWLLTLAAAFVIGGKINTSSNQESDNQAGQDNEQDRRPSYRQSGSSNTGTASTRRSNGSRSNGTGSGSSQSLSISDIAQNTDPIQRTKDLLDLINRMGPNDFEKAVSDFRALGNVRDRMSEYGILLHAWGKADPLGALDYAEKNTGTQYARQTILTSWAGNDPEAALTWAKDHHEGEGANPWLIGIIRGVVTKDPERASQIMQELPLSRERGQAIAAIVPHIANQGFDKASQWLESISDERLKSGGASYLAAELAKQDPEKTADWVAALADSDGKTRATREVAQKWAEQDLTAAVSWTGSLSGDEQTAAARAVIGRYAREDAAQAANWLRSISSNPGYERVVESYIWSTARSAPEMSLAQISEIQDERSQNRYYSRILRMWRGQNAQAAEAWMDNNNVSDDIRSSVLRENRNRNRRGR